jgi:hypothetical protein
MLEDILNFPTYILDRDTSEQDLCKEISGVGNKSFPEFGELVRAIKQDEHLIDVWIEYAANKRATPSWYFSKQGDFHKVGFISEDGNCDEGTYIDPHFACAVFIKLEMQSRLT